MDDKLHDIDSIIAWVIAGVVLLWVLFGCSPCKYCTSTPQVDSLIIEKTDTIIMRDTTYMYQPQDSTASNVVEDTEKSHLETDLATSDAWVDNGKLHHSLSNKTDLIPIPVQIPNYISSERRYLTRTIIKEVEKDLKWYQETLIYMGIVLLIIILIKLLWRRNLG